MLLFGRNVQTHINGAYSLFSVYPGVDRSEPHAERSELAGTLIDQARRLVELLISNPMSHSTRPIGAAPNAVKYPPQALHEATINALAHRDYEIVEPARITVFSDRVEVLSPVLCRLVFPSRTSGRDAHQQSGGIKPCLVPNRLQLAQAEGQGIPTILRSMREEGCPPPQFQVNEVRVVCILPAHPRHALAREHRALEEAISLGEFERAQKAVLGLLAQDR